jgi:cell division protein FtsQ
MKKKKKQQEDYASRQLRRLKQRGALNRSTMIALMVVAAFGAFVSQYDKFPEWTSQAEGKFIAWTVKQGFTVQKVDLEGRNRVNAEFVMNALKIERGVPTLSYDIAGAHERLMKNPWFKSVQIERRLPQTIFVRVIERVPVARWQTGGKLTLVDAEGVILTASTLDAYKDLPVIVGSEARLKIAALFSLLSGQPEIASDVVAATWVGNRRWDLKLANGMAVKLPADDAELALAQLAAMHRDEQVLERDIIAVDLRLPDRAVLTPSTRANTLIERPDFRNDDTGKQNI